MRVLGSNLNGWPEYTSSFQQDIVLKAELANNVDRPESTLDALMQAIVCKARLGWRPDSRKIVVIATDQGFHSALDGKLVGVLTPNDGDCHLDAEGWYTRSKVLDYPSVSHIGKVAKENAITILFLVGSKRQRSNR